jgi:hypothetical protein
MIRAPALIWAGLVVLSGLFLYQVKHDVQALEEELAAVNRRILATQDRIHVLRAEWSLLNEPARIGDLAQRHLALAPMRPDQFARPADIATRVALHQPAAPTLEPAAPTAAIADAALSLPLPPPFPAEPPRAVATRPAAAPSAAPAPAAPATVPARATPSPAPSPRPVPVEVAQPATLAGPPVRTAALPRPVSAAVAAPAVSALGAPTAALPPPVPRTAGGPR